MFAPFELRGMKLHNRVVVSSMCQYSARDGLIDDYHLAHYGALALGGDAAADDDLLGALAAAAWLNASLPAAEPYAGLLKAWRKPGVEVLDDSALERLPEPLPCHPIDTRSRLDDALAAVLMAEGKLA